MTNNDPYAEARRVLADDAVKQIAEGLQRNVSKALILTEWMTVVRGVEAELARLTAPVTGDRAELMETARGRIAALALAGQHGGIEIIGKLIEALEADDRREAALAGAIRALIPWLESAETKCLVGDEGCVWAVEEVRAILAKVSAEGVEYAAQKVDLVSLDHEIAALAGRPDGGER